MSFLRKHVLPLTNPYPGPQSILVLDNCSIHHAEAVCDLIKDEALCRLVYLPLYLPDFMPIKEAFPAIKAYLHHHHHDLSLLLMDEACHSITPEAALDFIQSCGYAV
jgi:transposase